MSIEEALAVLNIPVDICKLDEETLKRAFRMMMKHNHPDVGGTEDTAKRINKANEVLTLALEKLKKFRADNTKSEITCVIPFDALAKIYSGECIKVGRSGNTIDIAKSNLRIHNVLMEIKVTLCIDETQLQFSTIVPRNDSDTYSIQCKIPVSDMCKQLNINIIAYSKNLSTSMIGTNLNMALTFDYNIKLKVMLERQMIQDE